MSKRLAENCTLEKGEQQLERTVCVSVKSITCMTSIPTCVLVCRYYKSIVLSILIIKPHSSTPEWLAARIAPVP